MSCPRVFLLAGVAISSVWPVVSIDFSSVSRKKSIARLGLEYKPGEDGTYSQNYQDVWIEHLSKLNGWDETSSQPGFFLDLGAFKGYECSNTALVEKKFGWNGICVEPRPAPSAFQGRKCSLVEKRPVSAKTFDEVAFHGAVGTQLQHIGFQQGVDRPGQDKVEILSAINIQDLLSCLNGEQDETTNTSEKRTFLQSEISKSSETEMKKDTKARCANVPALPNGVPSFINFISLDVEGQGDNVIMQFPYDKYTVGAWVIEDPSQKAVAKLNDNGYVKLGVDNPGVDEYWVHKTLTKTDAETLKKAWRIHPDGSNGC